MAPPLKTPAARTRRWPAPALCLLLAAPALPVQECRAQEAADFETRETLPPEAVLVVRLISATEVVPTTGIVVGTAGEVLVPDAFVSDEGETVVLDGGGDVARHGRPATVVQRLPQAGLALLRAPKLERPPAVLAADPGADGAELRLGAFPPARLLAAGTGPMWLKATLSANPGAAIYGLAEATPIPNVSGPLFNRCGQWAGYSVAIGEPAIKSQFQPIVLFSPELARVLRQLGVEPATAPCAPAPEPEPEAPTPPGPEDAATAEIDAAPEAEVPGSSGDGAGTVAAEPMAAAPRQENPPAAGVAPWMLLVAAIVAGAVTAGALVALRRRRADPGPEPDTRVLAEGPRSGAAPAEPDWSALPPGCDRWLVLETLHADATEPSRWRCAIGGDRFAVRIGRSDADLVIPHASVSRTHARLDGAGSAITVQDLGSANGTFIGRAPCLPGERFRLQPGDTLMLGGLPLRLAIVAPEDAGGVEA